MRSRSAVTGAVAVVLATTAAALALVTVAHAAVLPVRSAMLMAGTVDGSGVPDPLAADAFDGPRDDLDGRTSDTGQRWVTLTDEWETDRDGRAFCSGCNDLSGAALDAGQAEVVVRVTLHTPENQVGAGLALNVADDAGSGLLLLYRHQGQGRLELQRLGLSGGSGTQVIADRVGRPVRGGDVELVVVVRERTLTVSMDGVTVATHTLSASDWQVLRRNTVFGIVSDGDEDTRFDDFWVGP